MYAAANRVLDEPCFPTRRTAPAAVLLWSQLSATADPQVLRSLPRTRPGYRSFVAGPRLDWGRTPPRHPARVPQEATDTISAVALWPPVATGVRPIIDAHRDFRPLTVGTASAMTPQQRSEFETTTRALYDGMVRIVVTPTWAKLLDFETTLPSAVEDLAQRQAKRSQE